MRTQLEKLGLRPLGDRFHPPSAAYLTALEQAIGCALPREYRDFLATYGVCTFSDYVTFAPPGGPRVDLNIFLGSDPDDSYDVLTMWRSLPSGTRSTLLPCAVDPFGNAVCLDLSHEHFGRICYWDHETEAITPVAASFPAFIAILRREAVDVP